MYFYKRNSNSSFSFCSNFICPIFLIFLLELGICSSGATSFLITDKENNNNNNINISEEEYDQSAARTLKPTIVKLPQNYSLHQSPPLIDEKSVPVEFSILLFNVFDIKELQGEISLEVNLKLYWKDTRLANWTGNIEKGQKYTVLNPSLITQIWHPDVFIDHMKGISQPSLISKAASLRIYPDGSLRYSARMLLVMCCRMDFYYYPADTQKCSMDLKSYAFSTKYITLSWRDGTGAEMAYPIDVHNFNVALGTSPDFLQQTKSANYSGIQFTLFLQRKLSYHIIQTFIPSALFTIVSWLSFLVPPESTPGRMALCVTTLLTLTAMFAAVRQNTPSVSYIKALDIWMVICIIFVFSVLAEYTVVLKLRSMKQKKPNTKKRSSSKITDGLTYGPRGSSESSSPTCLKRSTNTNNIMLDFSINNDKTIIDPLLAPGGSRPMTPAASPPPRIPILNQPQEKEDNNKGPTKYFILACKIEKYTPRIMPIVFILFNCFYWPYLLILSDYYKLRGDSDMYYSLE